MRFAKITFWIAGIYGILVVPPLYFFEARIGREQPPAITHPEYYYGFVGVALAWQIAFMIIATDPVRFRPLMLAALVEKFTYVIAGATLWSHGRIPASLKPFIFVDLLFGVFFAAAYLRVRSSSPRGDFG